MLQHSDLMSDSNILQLQCSARFSMNEALAKRIAMDRRCTCSFNDLSRFGIHEGDNGQRRRKSG